MKNILSIGSTPTEESCAQIGKDGYDTRSRIECRVFRDQLERQFGSGPDGAYLAIKSFPHDYGSYREVVVVYDDHDEEAADWAFGVENNCPSKWDDQAREELIALIADINLYE